MVDRGQIEQAVVQKISRDQRHRADARRIRGAWKRIAHAAHVGRGSGGAQTAGEQREGDREAVSHEKSGGLAILRAHQNLTAALHQRESIREVRRGSRQGQKKSRLAAAEGNERGNQGAKGRRAGACRSAEDAGEECLQRGKIVGLVQLADQIGRDAEEPRFGRCFDAELLRGVAVDLEQLDFQHHFAAGLFHLLDQFAGEGQLLRRVTHGNGAAAGVGSDVR